MNDVNNIVISLVLVVYILCFECLQNANRPRGHWVARIPTPRNDVIGEKQMR